MSTVHVPNHQYSLEEVKSIISKMDKIDNSGGIHTNLAGGGWGSSFYSFGTMVENGLTKFVVLGAVVGVAAARMMSKSDDEQDNEDSNDSQPLEFFSWFGSDDNNYHDSDIYVTVNHNAASVSKISVNSFYKDSYSGSEIVAMLNEFYALGWYPNQGDKHKIITNLLKGEYVNIDVPTEKSAGYLFGPQAVLDIEQVTTWNYLGNAALGVALAVGAGAISYAATAAAIGWSSSSTAAYVGAGATGAALLGTAGQNAANYYSDYTAVPSAPPAYFDQDETLPTYTEALQEDYSPSAPMEEEMTPPAYTPVGEL